MANNHTQGTVTPYLPLTALHLGALRLLDAFGDGGIPEGTDFDDEGNTVLRDADVLWETLEEFFPGADKDDAIQASLVFLGRELTIGLDFEPTLDTSERYYLFAEDRLGDGDLAWLEWVLSTLPEDQVPYIVVEYAETCSKMRQGEFGGGAWLITREENYFMTTGSWLSSKIQEETP